MRTGNVNEIAVTRRPLGIEFLARREQNDPVRLWNQAVTFDCNVPDLDPLIESSDAETWNGRERRASDAAQRLAFFICLAVELKSRAGTPDRAFRCNLGQIGI